MGPWPLARFGAAAELIGRREATTLPLLGALNPELLREARVVLGCDLESIGLSTDLDATNPTVVERGVRGIGMASGADARTFFAARATSPGTIGLTATVSASGIAYSIEHRLGGDLAKVAAARDVSDKTARNAADRLGQLAHTVDHVIEDWSTAGTDVRFGVVTQDRAAIAEVLSRSSIDRAQQTYFADTVAVWTKWDPNIIVRVAITAKGVVDEVGLVFRNIPGEHLVRVWRTFRLRADHAQRIGAFVGAMGTESADRFELRLQRSAEPVLEATFVPSNNAFSR